LALFSRCIPPWHMQALPAASAAMTALYGRECRTHRSRTEWTMCGCSLPQRSDFNRLQRWHVCMRMLYAVYCMLYVACCVYECMVMQHAMHAVPLHVVMLHVAHCMLFVVCCTLHAHRPTASSQSSRASQHSTRRRRASSTHMRSCWCRRLSQLAHAHCPPSPTHTSVSLGLSFVRAHTGI
jgi:hypothetical protein